MSTDPEPGSVIVVGGGVVGLACAHYLTDDGLSVTVIDRGAAGGACSAGNCGYICPSHVLPLTEPGAIRMALKSLLNPRAPFRVRPRLSPAMWRWFWQFARRCTHRQMLAAGVHLKAILDSSMSEYRRLVAAEQLACGWESRGLLYVLLTSHGMQEFAATDRLLTEHFGVAARRIEGDQLPELDAALRPGLAGAFLYEDDAHLRPAALTTNWAARLRERGVQIREQCEVEAIVKDGGAVTGLRTNQGVLRAERYVIAAGAWSAQLAGELGCRIPIEPGKGYSVTTTRPEPCPTYPILFPEHRVGATPFADAYRLGSMMEFVGFDDSIPAARIAQLRESAAPYLVTPSGEQEIDRWYGWRPMTPDSLPIIGPAPGLANVLLATGHNMLGMSLATATGKLTAELLAGRSPHIDAAPFSPQRFQ
ncbi:MAG: amino acid dehydrogenase [Planctomycetaceae bacterium]|nr:amino acid dehydrogenase [Planctomycetaceae bacterium]